MGIKKKKKLIVFASGNGSTFEALVRATRATGRLSHAEITALYTNRADCKACSRARALGVTTRIFNSKQARYSSLPSPYWQAIEEALRRDKPDLICLAGFLLILPQHFLLQCSARILNIHPSLLPAFKGLHAQKQAFDYGVRISGCTVHWVTRELDGGPLVAQEALRIRPTDSLASFSQRLLKLEHATYIEAIRHVLRSTKKSNLPRTEKP